MAQDPDDRSAFMDALDKSEEIATAIGLLASGIIFAAGVAALVFVMLHVMSTSPPSFGSQGEWLYGAIASLLVAGWGFSHGASLYARRRSRNTDTWQDNALAPKVQIGSDGISIDLTPRQQHSGDAKPATWTWSFNSTPVPLKTVTLTDGQLAAADAEAQSGVEWDVVCRRIAPEYAALSAFEQMIYRQALQTAVENRRRDGA